MKILNALCVIAGAAISVVAAYFSIVGLGAIFAATFIPVIIMGIALEFGKIIGATWLHHNWKNTVIGKFHKTYMAIAIAVLMIITSLGIYGFLSKGHLEQQAPVAGVELQIQQKELRLTQLQSRIAADNTRLTQLDSAVDAMIGSNKSQQALRYRSAQKAERAEIKKDQEAANTEINQITTDLLPLKTQISETEVKLGPIKYLAALFGIKDTEGAVRIMIALIMIAFDPLALILIISGTASFKKSEETITKLSEEIVEDDDKKIDRETPINENPIVDQEKDLLKNDYIPWINSEE